MKNKPIASVIIGAYNHENYIAEAIKSVIKQKCSFNFEIIVSDDCSTDNTIDIIKTFQSKHPDLIRIISNKKNLGVNISFFNAIKSAKGDFIASLGGDDYWIVENKLEMQVKMLLSNKEIAFIHTEFKSYNESEKTINNHNNKDWSSKLMNKTGKEGLIEMLRQKWTGYPLGSSSCYRKAPLLIALKNHPEQLNYNPVGEGTFLHASLSFYGGFYAFIPIQTTMYRIREKSMCHLESKEEEFKFKKNYYLLRLSIAKSFGLLYNEINLIKKQGLFQLFYFALKLNAMSEFHSFLQTESLDKKNKRYLDFLIKAMRFKIFRFAYLGKVKLLNLISI